MRTFYTLFKTKNALRISLLAALGWLGTSGLYAQISGNYTIDQSAAASATNYADFQSVVDDLRGNTRSDGGTANNTGSGVTGHATFTVVAGSGPYVWNSTKQLVIPEIPSTSSTATVTFKGNNEVINYTGSSTNRAAIQLNGADWFRFDSLEIYSLASSRAWGVQFRNNSNDNIIENCVVRVPNARSTTTSTTSTCAAIIFSGSNTTINNSQWGGNSYGSNGSRNIIRDNSVGGAATNAGNGVTYGIFIIGNSGASGADNNIIRDNLISNYYYRGIWSGFAENLTIDGNEITNPATTSGYRWGQSAIYHYNQNGNDVNDVTISKNRIHQNYGTSTNNAAQTVYGIYLYNWGRGNADIENNAIYDYLSSSTMYGVYYYSSASTPRVNYNHNTLSFDDQGYSFNGRLYAHYIGDNFGNFDAKNNNISITQTASSTTSQRWGWYDQDWSSATYQDNNVYVDRTNATNASGDYYGYRGGTNYDDLAAWQGIGRGNSSTELDPNYLDYANGDLRPLNFVINNSGANVGITDDINDSSRTLANPDPGAFEVAIDASLESFPWTDLNVCGDFEDSVKITIRNENNFAIRGVPVYFAINADRVDEIVDSTIAAGASYVYTFSRTAVFNDPGVNNFVAGISVADDNPANNTTTYSVNVTTSPEGSMLSNNNPDPRPLNGAIHNLSGFDITVPGVPLDYTFSAPAPNNSSSYGAYTTDWTASSELRTKDGGTVTTGNVDAPGTNDINVTVDPDISMTDSMLTLYVTFVDAVSGCDTTYQKDILVAPRGVPDFSFPPTICVNELVVFDNLSTVSSGFLENTWRVTDPNNNVTFAEGTNPALSFSEPGDWTVELISETNPYSFRDSNIQTVTVTPIPTVDFTRVNACEGEPIVLTNQTTPADANYTWDFGDGSATVMTTNATKTYTPGGYPVTLRAEKNGCAAEITKNVYQFARPVANAAVVDGLCDNDDFTFENNSTISVGNTGYLWDFDEPNSVSTAINPTYDFQTPGMKEVRLRAVSEFGCEDTLDIPLVVNVLEAPNATFVIDQTCSETPSTFTNNSTTPANSTNTNTWTIEGVTGVDNNATKTHSWSTTGSQVVTLLVESDNGCTDEVIEDVEVLVQPKADFVLTDVCQGEEVQLANLSEWPEGDISYVWDMPAATPSTSTDGAPSITINAAPGNYNFRLTATIAGGCSDERDIPVEVKPLPETCDFTITDDFANGLNNFDLTPTGGATAGTNYTWIYSFGGQDQTVASGKEDVLFPAGIGTITVRMVADRDGCNCTSTQTLQLSSTKLVNGGEFNVYPNPTAGKLNIEVKDNNESLTVGIYNSIGVEVARVNTNNAQNGNFDVDLSDLAAGLYIVRVTTGSDVTTKRITLTK